MALQVTREGAALVLRLRDRVTGERREMALFGSLLEHDGRYKLVSLNIGR